MSFVDPNLPPEPSQMAIEYEDRSDTEQTPLLKADMKQHISNAQMQEIAEREAGIREIHSTMLEVHGIYQDIGILVNEQQYAIDNIEINVESTFGYTRAAKDELVTSDRRRGKRKARFFCIIFLAILVFVFVGTIIASI